MDPTRPPEIEFEKVSPKLAQVRLLVIGVILAIALIAGVILAVVISPFIWIGVALVVLIAAYILWLVPRQVRNIGFAVTENEFLVRRGALIRRLSVVPYGRIQFAEVHEGPLDRQFGIASVQLHTASAGTDAQIDGLTAVQANELRAQLAARSTGQLSGL